jgi:hypothetical protein
MKVIHLASMSTCETNLKERVKSAQEVDEFFKTMKDTPRERATRVEV